MWWPVARAPHSAHKIGPRYHGPTSIFRRFSKVKPPHHGVGHTPVEKQKRDPLMSERAVQKVIRWRAKGLSLKLAQGQAVATTHRYLEAMIEPPQDSPIAFEREVNVPRIRWNPKKEPFGAHIDRFRKAVLRDPETLGKIFQWKGRVVLCSDFRNFDYANALVWWINFHTPETLARFRRTLKQLTTPHRSGAKRLGPHKNPPP